MLVCYCLLHLEWCVIQYNNNNNNNEFTFLESLVLNFFNPLNAKTIYIYARVYLVWGTWSHRCADVDMTNQITVWFSAYILPHARVIVFFYLRSIMDSRLKGIVSAAVCSLGYDSLRSGQEIASFLCQRDVFVSLPTRYGKSLCYAALPGAFDLLLGRRPSTHCCFAFHVTSSRYSGSRDRMHHT